MSVQFQRTAEQLVDLHARVLRAWNENPDITLQALSQRFAYATNSISKLLREAKADGRTTREPFRGGARL